MAHTIECIACMLTKEPKSSKKATAQLCLDLDRTVVWTNINQPCLSNRETSLAGVTNVSVKVPKDYCFLPLGLPTWTSLVSETSLVRSHSSCPLSTVANALRSSSAQPRRCTPFLLASPSATGERGRQNSTPRSPD